MKERAGSTTLLLFALTALVMAVVQFSGWYCRQWLPANGGPSLDHANTAMEPFTVLVMGTDIAYLPLPPHGPQVDSQALSGRSDMMMLIKVDPRQKTMMGINIPRDTICQIPGYGEQKVNAANAIGGPGLANEVVSEMLRVPVDHSLTINVQGFVDAVNELGGITVEVPKKMSYMDWTAKLKIDLEPGVHTLTGNQAMGFVRFRHDDMGDIGRIQRQQILMQALVAKLLNPVSWTHFPRLAQIAKRSTITDMTDVQLLETFNIVRSIPRSQIQFAILPGRFGNSGNWVQDKLETSRLMERLYGERTAPQDRGHLTICLKNVSSFPGLTERMAHLLRRSGYTFVVSERASKAERTVRKTRVIAQRGNYGEAQMVLSDLGNHGEIINASVGNIYSSITVLLADDLEPIMRSEITVENSTRYE